MVATLDSTPRCPLLTMKPSSISSHGHFGANPETFDIAGIL